MGESKIFKNHENQFYLYFNQERQAQIDVPNLKHIHKLYFLTSTNQEIYNQEFLSYVGHLSPMRI
jgi:hypothetical protein